MRVSPGVNLTAVDLHVHDSRTGWVASGMSSTPGTTSPPVSLATADGGANWAWVR